MKSRHTPIKNKLTRSFGLDGSEDLVVEMNEEGFVAFRREPVDRKLKRGEQLPEVRLDVRDMCEDLSAPAAQESDVTTLLEQLTSKVPIAKFDGENPQKLAYSMKVWLLEELKQIIADQKNG